MYCLCIQYNDLAPFTALSNDAGGLGAVLTASEGEQMSLRVLVTREGSSADYCVRTVRPGDSLRISYRVAQPDDIDNLATIVDCERIDDHSATTGMRFGVDVESVGRPSIRLSHPNEGTLDLIIGNVPLRYARSFALAYSESEDWSWQLCNLLDEVALDMKVVETSWWSTFPNERSRKPE